MYVVGDTTYVKGNDHQYHALGPVIFDLFETTRNKAEECFDPIGLAEAHSWPLAAALPHVGDFRGSTSTPTVLKVNWETALEWFNALNNGRWATYTEKTLWYGETTGIIFDPTHPATAAVAERIESILGEGSGEACLDDQRLREAERAERRSFFSRYGWNNRVPNGIEIDAAIDAMGHAAVEWEHAHRADVTEAVQSIPHTFDQGDEPVDSRQHKPQQFLCVCELKQEHRIHRPAPSEHREA